VSGSLEKSGPPLSFQLDFNHFAGIYLQNTEVSMISLESIGKLQELEV
jgi:hypothetical protein